MKMFAHCSGDRVCTVDTIIASQRLSEFEISKKLFLERKMKMIANCSGDCAGADESSDAPVRPYRSNFFAPQNENVRTLVRELRRCR